MPVTTTRTTMTAIVTAIHFGLWCWPGSASSTGGGACVVLIPESCRNGPMSHYGNWSSLLQGHSPDTQLSPDLLLSCPSTAPLGERGHGGGLAPEPLRAASGAPATTRGTGRDRRRWERRALRGAWRTGRRGAIPARCDFSAELILLRGAGDPDRAP